MLAVILELSKRVFTKRLGVRKVAQPNGVRLSCGAELELSQTEDYLRNRGAGSFRRLLGGRPTGLSTHPAAHPSPRENSSENRKHDGANVCALTHTRPGGQGAYIGAIVFPILAAVFALTARS